MMKNAKKGVGREVQGMDYKNTKERMKNIKEGLKDGGSGGE